MSMKPLDELGSTLRVPDSLRDPQPPVGLDRWEKIALVAPNVHIAEMKIREYRDQPWMKIIWPGVCVAGYRFPLILVSGSVLNDILRGAPETYQRWWHEAVMTRLPPHGKIVTLP
jgi:hypothetical protein